jgi:NAD(P)-dependent dehydrogenase (short-subunit alcohol dehydrogenase family)
MHRVRGWRTRAPYNCVAKQWSNEMGLLDGKVAIVTGAGAGLGRAYAQLLAREGAAVVVNDFAQGPAEEVATGIREEAGTAVANVADVGSIEGGERIVQDALSAFGRIDILVNNAGILRDKSLIKMDEVDWDAVIRVHLKGTYCVTRPVFAQMKEAGRGGVIVNTTSTSGLRGKFGQTNYGAAKAGIWGFSNSLTQEGLKYGIRVWTIAPAAASQLIDGLVSDEYKKVFTPERVAPVVLYMVSDLSGQQTGKTLLAGGGYVGEIRMEIGPGIIPPERFDAQGLAAAVAEGKVMLAERDLNFVNAYGPASSH